MCESGKGDGDLKEPEMFMNVFPFRVRNTFSTPRRCGPQCPYPFNALPERRLDMLMERKREEKRRCRRCTKPTGLVKSPQ